MRPARRSRKHCTRPRPRHLQALQGVRLGGARPTSRGHVPPRRACPRSPVAAPCKAGGSPSCQRTRRGGRGGPFPPHPRSGAHAQGRVAGHGDATRPADDARGGLDRPPHAPGAAGVHAQGRALRRRCPAMRRKALRKPPRAAPPSAAHGAGGSAGTRPRERGGEGERRPGLPWRGAAVAGGPQQAAKGAGKEGGGANPCTTRPPARGDRVRKAEGRWPRPLLSTGGMQRPGGPIPTPPIDLPDSAEGGSSREEWTAGGTGSTGPRACGTGAGPRRGRAVRPSAWTPDARLRRRRPARMASQEVCPC